MSARASVQTSFVKAFVLLSGLILFCSALLADNVNSIIYSKHNLSASGTGAARSSTEVDVCIFCHAPHNAMATSGPLWNHELSTATYIPYSSPTLKATVGQPTGSSKLCLSCHDGTVALGLLHTRSSVVSVSGTTIPSAANVGTDLSADHPISFIYDSDLATRNGKLVDPGALPPEVQLDKEGQMQCTSCHDPHSKQYPYFLVVDNTSSGLCTKCHRMSTWSLATHAVSSQPLPAALLNQGASKEKTAVSKNPTTVAAAGCASCHMPHAAGTKQELMRFNTPEQNCFSCHSGDGPGQNVAADFKKISTHPILLNAQTHQAQEDPVNPSARHVTCADCHNPHASTSSPGSLFQASGALSGVVGVNAGGSVVQSVSREYELCFRCHADSGNRGPARVTRQWPESNKRLQFNPANQSFHPIEAAGRRPNVPSLIAPWTASSLMTCSDCHSGDQGKSKAASQASRTPHGSAFAPILEQPLVLTDYSPESAANYALCYKCHSRDSILGDQSFRAFNHLNQDRGHRFHIVDEKTACTTCHDSHGVVNNPGLINFNLDYVSPASNGQLRYTSGSLGIFSGNCTLKCHGKDHVDTAYSPASILRSSSLLRR